MFVRTERGRHALLQGPLKEGMSAHERGGGEAASPSAVEAQRRTGLRGNALSQRAYVLRGLVLVVLCFCMGMCVTPNIGHLEVVAPCRFQLMYSPAWFGTIVLPPGRVTADLQYAGDACETLLGTYAVRGKVALVDRGKCSFVQKVSPPAAAASSHPHALAKSCMRKAAEAVSLASLNRLCTNNRRCTRSRPGQ